MRTKLVLTSALVTLAGLVATVPADADSLGRAGPVRYVVKSATLTSSLPDGAEAQANCPVGWKAISGGATIKPGATRGLGWNDKAPGSSSRGWVAEAWQTSAKSTTLRTYGVCLETSLLTVDTGSIFSAPGGTVTATASCPEGSIVVGGGGRPIGDTSDWTMNTSHNVDGPDADPVPNDGWRAYYHYTGSDGDLLVDAVCVGSVGEPAYRSTSTSVLPRSTKTVKSSCGAGEHVLGGGAYINGSAASARVAGSRPFDSGDAGTVPDDGWLVTYRNTSDSPLTAEARSICS